MPLSPGTRLGPYEVLAPLGSGGMGEVYRARDARLGRDVAVKVLPPTVADSPDALARFERETQAVAALSEHGRVAPVILYQRTEYAASMIDGRTVTETAPSGRSAQEIAELWQAVYAQIGLRVAA